MYRLDDVVVVSPTDLTRFLACRHASWLDLRVADGALVPPAAAEGTDEVLASLFQRGRDHEAAYKQSLLDAGRTMVEIDFGHGREQLEAAERATEEAMAAGAEVIYQATFFDGRWRGHADFLLRRDDRPGRWGWSYDVADTKLARRMKVAALLQMATYADRLTTMQDVEPQRLTVVTGDGLKRSYRFADAAAYAASVRQRMLGFLDDVAAGTAEPTRPEPVAHCAQCRWLPRCRAQWRAEDDLSLVAFMRRDHARALREAGVATVRALGSQEPEQLPATIGEPARVRLAAQARLQLAERDTGQAQVERLAPEAGRGLALLPAPSPGDVFFDIEGDPWVGEDGLEYLFGVWDATGFTAFWATDPSQEKKAFEDLVDYLMAAWARDPGMHVYHYAPYEPTRLKALAGRYGTRGDELDRLLRGLRLVDLYAVVRQGIRVSKESYSIKQLEAFYWGHARAHEGVSDALGSVVAFERWLVDRDDALLADIAAYNEDDCRSTEALRDWLEGLRADGGGDAVFPRPEHGDGAPSEAALEAADEVTRLAGALLEGVPDAAADRDEVAQGRFLLAGVLDWHRREALPEWWDFFRRLELDDEELVEDTAALGQLSAPTEHEVVKSSTVWAMSFPPQETKLGVDESGWLDPRTGRQVGTVVDVDPEQGVLLLKRATKRGAPEATSLVPGKPLLDREQRARLRELAGWVLAHGLDDPSPPWRAARDLLLRRPPRRRPPRGAGQGVGTDGLRLPGESAEQALCRLARELDGGVLPVQGPPGTGKTWAGARMVLRLIADGKRVGVTAFSHKAISNLLDAVAAAAAEQGVTLRALQKAGEHQRCASPAVEATDSNEAVEGALSAGEVDLVAGTSWLFARPGMQGAVDVLVVDEAGQLSLANVLAVSGSASSVVLLGDPQQLAQPVKGSHPDGAGTSALEHLLAGAATVDPARGLLLDVTWRMHADVAGFVSALSYDGRLGVERGCCRQRVGSASPLGGTGLRLSLVEHADNAAASTEEALEVARLCRELLADGTWTDARGVTRRLVASDVLVLTPFNAQVNRIRSYLGQLAVAGVRVGTVDKFQGQEAPVVLYSLATSSAEDAPRGLEFLFSVNRFNVALSRARALACVVASPALLSASVRSPEQLRLANAFCWFAREAVRVEPEGLPD